MQTPEIRLLMALDELRGAMGAYVAQRRPAPDTALLTITRAAELIGVSRSTASRWADEGRLQTYGVKNARRVPRSEIARLAGTAPSAEAADAEGTD